MIKELHREHERELPPGALSATRRRHRQASYERTAARAVSASFPRPLPSAILVSQSAETVLEFCTFDAQYVDNLREGDRATEEHFVGYFTALLHLKLRSKLGSPQAIEDVRQETFARVLRTVREPGKLRQPDRLGAYVNQTCNNVLFEHYRGATRTDSLDEEGQPELPASGANALDIVVSKQVTVKVREVLLHMAPRDRSLLKAVFLDERDRDEVCDEFGVDREYLRVLLYRAKKDFKAEYLKRLGNHVPLGPRVHEARREDEHHES